MVSEVTKFDNLDKGKRYQFRTFAGGEAVPVIYETISDNLRYQSGVPLDVEGDVRIGLKYHSRSIVYDAPVFLVVWGTIEQGHHKVKPLQFISTKKNIFVMDDDD